MTETIMEMDDNSYGEEINCFEEIDDRYVACELQQLSRRLGFDAKARVGGCETDGETVLDMVLLRDGLMVSTSEGSIHMLHSDTLQSNRELKAHDGAIRTLVTVEQDSGSCLMSFSEDCSCKLWDMRMPDPVIKLIFSNRPIYSGDCNGRAVVAGSEQGEICLWDLRSPNKVLGVLDELHTEEITQLKFHPVHKSVFFSGSVDTLVTKFDLAAPSLDDALEMVYSTDQPVRKLCFFGDQLEFIACLSEIETMQLFSLAQDECISQLSETICSDISTKWMSTRYLVDCVYDAPTHGLLLVSGNYYGDLLTSSVSRTGLTPQFSLLGHTCGVRCVLPSSDGSVIYSGDDSGFICRWKSRIGQ